MKIAFRTLKWFCLEHDQILKKGDFWIDRIFIQVMDTQFNHPRTVWWEDTEQQAFQWLKDNGYIEPIVNNNIEVPK